MSSSSHVDRRSDHFSQPRGFLTPPPTWKTNRRSPAMPRSEMKPKTTSLQLRGDMFHIIHKIPAGDSPYVRAKHVQLVEKDPGRAISLFWAAINAGDRVDSSLKDMAVVMKQMNRSDEAIEAIKSFRHLSPPESQESIDNILVELFKQSGRIEEEIDLLRHKLKQVEEGMAFSGKKTKIARSQGKKIQITVQKECSRLLGNLAWAYMHHGDFKSAEEHYRKALSFEADKNKQCNLAVCLMHMNKMTEAKFLLETMPSDNGVVDESYSKSYERASEILAEFESQRILSPTKQMEQNNEGRMVKGFTDFAYERRADFDCRTNHCNQEEEACSDISEVALTQPWRCPRSGDERKPDIEENAQGSHCRKLSFESSINQDFNVPHEMADIFPHFLENSPVKSAGSTVEEEEEETINKKSWADNMVEEEGFDDENMDYNIIGLIDLGEGHLTQPDKKKNQPLRRSLCFDEDHILPDLQKLSYSSPLAANVLNFEGHGGNNKNRRRLQVFQDITRLHVSPRP